MTGKSGYVGQELGDEKIHVDVSYPTLLIVRYTGGTGTEVMIQNHMGGVQITGTFDSDMPILIKGNYEVAKSFPVLYSTDRGAIFLSGDAVKEFLKCVQSTPEFLIRFYDMNHEKHDFKVKSGGLGRYLK